MLGPFFPGKARRLLVRKEKRVLKIQAFLSNESVPLSCAPRKWQRSFGPCAACAAHFAFSETGQAGHTLGVCCFAPKIRCAHFGAPLANPAPSVPLKNTNSNANNWRICVFLTRHSDGPGTQPAAQEPGLRPVGLGTRLRAQNGKRGGVFRRARNSKNDIRALTRCACAGKRDLE